MKEYEAIKKYDNNVWLGVGGDFGLDDWVHNYYRFKDKMVSVYSNNAFNDDFSIAVFKIKDLRRKYNWYDKKLLEKDNITLSDVIDIIEQVKGGKLK